MKYTPLNNLPNISLSRLGSISPSLKMDSNGYPHIAWLDVGNNINNVNYTYWNGTQWSFYDIPKIYISNESIIFSPSALVLDSLNSPLITFARKLGTGSRLSFASYNTEWVFSDLDVTYDVGWIGLIRYDGHIDPDFSSSSSQSLSMSSYSISSSSSSLESKSSSSTLSSSSSSYSHVVYYVCVYDVTHELFKIYSVVNGTWDITPVSSPTATVNNFESLRIAICGRRMGIAYVDNGSLSSSSSGSYHSGTIKYNFLDLDDFSTWSFPPTFQDLIDSLSYGEIIDMDMKGYYEEDASIMAFGWISRTSNTSYVCSVLADNNGTETSSNYVTPVVESQVINIIVPSDYIVNSYRKIALCLDDSNLIRMVASGAASKLFWLFSSGTGRFWFLDPVDVSGISNGMVPLYLGMEFSDTTKLVMAADSGDVYYFEQSASPSFPMSTPDLVLPNDLWAYRVPYSSGALSGVSIAGTYDNIVGDILRDSERRLFITSNPITPVTTTTTTGTLTTTTTTPAPSSYVWTQRTASGSRLWISVANSSDGVKLVAGAGNFSSGGYTYTSTDSGLGWTQRTSMGFGSWVVSSSSDGVNLAIVNEDSTSVSQYIYTSTNSGLSWTQRTSAGNRKWRDICCSSNGSKIIACATAATPINYIYTSDDGGVSWTERSSMGGNHRWNSLACSSDGNTIIAADFTDGYYVSSNFGSTWTLTGLKPTSSVHNLVCCSSDASKIYALGFANNIYYSDNLGSTWSILSGAGTKSYMAIACSSDGSVIAAAGYVISSLLDNYIYVSRDYGSSWSQQISIGNHRWSCLSSSSNGNNIVAGTLNEYIYTGVY